MILDRLGGQMSKVLLEPVINLVRLLLPGFVVRTEVLGMSGFLKLFRSCIHEDEVQAGAGFCGVQKIGNIVVSNIYGIARVTNISVKYDREERNGTVLNARLRCTDREIKNDIRIRYCISITAVNNVFVRLQALQFLRLALHSGLTGLNILAVVVRTEHVSDGGKCNTLCSEFGCIL